MDGAQNINFLSFSSWLVISSNILTQYFDRQSGSLNIDFKYNKKRYDTSVISIASIFYRSQNRAPSVWKNMPQIQPMYFHRHRDTLIQQTSEARRRHVTNAFNTYVVCQKSACTPFIFSTEKRIYLLLQKYFISKYTRNFIENLTKTRHLQPFPCTSEPSAGQRSTSLYDVT